MRQPCRCVAPALSVRVRARTSARIPRTCVLCFTGGWPDSYSTATAAAAGTACGRRHGGPKHLRVAGLVHCCGAATPFASNGCVRCPDACTVCGLCVNASSTPLLRLVRQACCAWCECGCSVLRTQTAHVQTLREQCGGFQRVRMLPMSAPARCLGCARCMLWVLAAWCAVPWAQSCGTRGRLLCVGTVAGWHRQRPSVLLTALT